MRHLTKILISITRATRQTRCSESLMLSNIDRSLMQMLQCHQHSQRSKKRECKRRTISSKCTHRLLNWKRMSLLAITNLFSKSWHSSSNNRCIRPRAKKEVFKSHHPLQLFHNRKLNKRTSHPAYVGHQTRQSEFPPTLVNPRLWSLAKRNLN